MRARRTRPRAHGRGRGGVGADPGRRSRLAGERLEPSRDDRAADGGRRRRQHRRGGERRRRAADARDAIPGELVAEGGQQPRPPRRPRPAGAGAWGRGPRSRPCEGCRRSGGARIPQQDRSRIPCRNACAGVTAKPRCASSSAGVTEALPGQPPEPRGRLGQAVHQPGTATTAATDAEHLCRGVAEVDHDLVHRLCAAGRDREEQSSRIESSPCGPGRPGGSHRRQGRSAGPRRRTRQAPPRPPRRPPSRPRAGPRRPPRPSPAPSCDRATHAQSLRSHRAWAVAGQCWTEPPACAAALSLSLDPPLWVIAGRSSGSSGRAWSAPSG